MSEIIIYQDWLETKKYLQQKFTHHHYTSEQIVWIDCEKTPDLELLLCQQQIFCIPAAYVLMNANFLTNAPQFQKQKHILTAVIKLQKDLDFYLLTTKKLLTNAEIKQAINSFVVTELKITTQKQKEKIIHQLLVDCQVELPPAVCTRLLVCTDFNYGNIQNEVNKIVNLLTTDCCQADIMANICNYNDENIFALLEAIVCKQHAKVWTIYQDLISRHIDELVIIPALTSQALNLYYCLQLSQLRMAASEISQKLGMNSYFVIQHLNKFKQYKFNIFKEIILILYNLEINIKLSKVDKQVAFKVCLLSLTKL